MQPEQCEEESGGSKGRKGEPAFSAVAYVREWGDLAYKALGKPSPLPPWPPPLHAALRRPRPSIGAVSAVAVARRPFLKRAYQTGGRVSRVGLRVALAGMGPTPEELACDAHLPTVTPVPGQPAAPPASPLFCAVGHMRPRVPPIGGERSPWAALNQELLAQQQQHVAGATRHELSDSPRPVRGGRQPPPHVPPDRPTSRARAAPLPPTRPTAAPPLHHHCTTAAPPLHHCCAR